MVRETIERARGDGELEEELEMLLDEIPHARLHNLHHHRHRRGVDDDERDCVFFTKQTHYGHYNGNGNGHDYGYGNGVCYNDGFKSPMSGFSLQSEDSSSSLFSMSPPPLEDLKSRVASRSSYYPNNHHHYLNNLYLNSMIPDSTVKLNETERLVHELGMCSNFSKMCIADDTHQNRNFLPFGREFVNNVPNTRGGGGGDCDNFGRRYSDSVGFQSPVARTKSSVTRAAEINSALLGLTQDDKMNNLFESLQSCPRLHERQMLSQLNGFSGGSMDFPRRGRQLTSNYSGSESVVPMIAGSLSQNPAVDAASHHAQKYGINLLEERGVSRLPNSPNFKPCMSVHEFLQYGLSQPNARVVPLLNSRIPRGNLDAITSEGSFIIQGEGLNYVVSRDSDHSRCQHSVRESGFAKQLQPSELDIRHQIVGYENPRSPRNGFTFPMLPKYNSLAEARGSLYLIAKDQHGCRFLQRMFDEGTLEDVQVIFSEIIDHVVELMMNPFGNYLMQKLLDVCDQEQRMQIILVVTQERGQLVRISLNTHGTRVVQKLIETLKTRQQISLVVSALQPGFLALIKDLNGNHVVQHCLQCLSTEDNKFIFVAAAKYCVDIATHQHGCCVLQRCIGHSSGELRENLVAEISTNALLLAQDQYGNYVVQFILDLRIPSATATLSLLFEGKYVHLSMQKFSSHVVEKCLAVFNDENRSRVIHELLWAPHFEQLLQDPHANYVVQSALRHSEGHVRNLLVEAIGSHKAISRNSPYSKKIFSQKLLKK